MLTLLGIVLVVVVAGWLDARLPWQHAVRHDRMGERV